MLLSIFSKTSPLHDGATIVSGNIIIRAATMLPIDSEVEDYQLGARHKAAVGITKVSDAVAVVVSEERKVISLVIEGKVEPDLETEELKFHLLNQLTKKVDVKNKVGNVLPKLPQRNNQQDNIQKHDNRNKFDGGRK